MLENNIAVWILEYCYTLAKKEFREKKQIEDYISRDFIQGVLDQLEVSGDVSVRSRCIVQILVIMCKLADGQDITVEYEEGTEMSALEGVLERLDCLMESEDVKSNLTDFKHLVKQQAVFVYARNGDFTSASMLASRLYGGRAAPEDKAFKRRVDDILKAKDPAHPFLSQYSYDKLLEVWFTNMEEIEAALKIHKPFLVEFAEKCTEYQNSLNGAKAKCWDDIDIDNRGEILHRLVQHFCPQSVPLSPNRRARWNKRRAAIQKNKEEVLGHFQTHMDSGDGELNGNVSTESDAELPPRPTRRKRNGSDLEASTPKKRTPKKMKKSRVEDTGSSEEVFEDPDTPASCLPSRPTPTKPRMSLAPKSPRPRPTLNIDRLSHLAMGGKAKRPWEPYEEESLWEGVQQYGVGKWAKIKEFQDLPMRSSVDLKDKWRNIMNDKHKFLTLSRKLGSIPEKRIKKK